MIKLAFAGNPNVGKSALINAIAGSNLTVGNWPGVTVEKKEARFTYKGEEIELVDLPGVYSLSPYSLEEKITRDFILEEKPDVVINVVDSTNLERNLYLSYLIKELDKPTIMALNFCDEFDKLKYKLNKKEFEQVMEMDAVRVSALKKIGITELMEKAMELSKKGKEKKYTLPFDRTTTSLIRRIECQISSDKSFEKAIKDYSSEFLAIKLIERDKHIIEKLKTKYGIDAQGKFEDEILNLEDKYDNDSETILAEQRYGAVNGVLAKTFTTSIKSRLDFTDKVDKILLNRVIGLPLFILIMAGVMAIVFNGSAPFIDWVDGFFGDFVAKYVGVLVEGTPDWLHSLIIDGIIGGVGGVLTFVPVMVFLYFFLAILEESGYMSRVAFLMDKIMRKLGLNGKSFVPMVVGFGCTVPAIYASRTLEDETSRKMTAAMTPFMSCGARLPVYGLFTAAFFGAKGGIIVVSLYLLGILIAILVGTVLKRFREFKVDEKALLIELPPYRIPSLKVILNSTWLRISSYIKRAGTVILGIMLILWALTYFPGKGDPNKSYIAKFGHSFSTIMAPTGFGDKWEVVAAIPPSIAAKEVVVGFLAQVLSTDEATVEEEEVEEYNFKEDLVDQVKGFIGAIKDSGVAMVSMDVKGLFSTPDTDEIEEEGRGIVQATANLWPNDNLAPLRAYSFMAFILLVVPCVATLGAIKHEFGWNFLGKIIGIMLVVPYVVSVLIFQIGKLFM
ncbi:ferrous iron transport protein B [Fusobacterium hominis]|uniref:Ferrous iron transport protein B n=1 Tax=Fusobacterium hominis TaxID=2764326 RepID=A0A7G9GZ81_9FUSO|nr:ferrous iron transport protein B [Fusobacterium hominis]QNM16113.1 ferrous iron transport protein B [Fusobacterium hominis]